MECVRLRSPSFHQRAYKYGVQFTPSTHTSHVKNFASLKYGSVKDDGGAEILTWYQSPSPGICFRIMAPSDDSTSVNLTNQSFSSARLINSFPRHDTIKLTKGNFVQCQHHIRLIIEGYELQGFLEGTIFTPPRLIASPEASGSEVIETEKVEVILTRFSFDFDAVLTLTSFSTEPLPFQHLVDVLLKFKSSIATIASTAIMAARMSPHRRNFLLWLMANMQGSLDLMVTRGAAGHLFKIGLTSRNLEVMLLGRDVGRAGTSNTMMPRLSAAVLSLVQRSGRFAGPITSQSRGPHAGQNFGQSSGQENASQKFGPIANCVKDATQYDSNFDNTTSYVPVPVGTSSWYPDFGATHHVCQNASRLNASTPFTGTSSLFMGNGAPTKISSIGNTVLSTAKKLLHLSNILCVPSIRKNLISVSQFVTDNNFSVDSIASLALNPSIHNTKIHNCPSDDDVFQLWHRRLGHPSSAIVKSVLNKCNIISNKNCLDTKMVFTQFGKNIKKFQSDWGGEFRAFVSVLASHGILHRLTYCHTSEQNGVDERKLKHVVETGLTLLAQANLPIDYWGYAFCSTVYLINQLPTPVLKGQSPYQILYGHDPASQHKGYNHLTLDGKVIISRHVIFYERRFLFSLPVVDIVQTPTLPVDGQNYESMQFGLIASPTTSNPLSNTSVDSAAASESGLRELYPATEDISLSTEIVIAPPVSPKNTHAMVTRSKARIFRPKVFAVDAVDFESSSVEEALAHKDWKLAVQAEFDALIANSTWELVPLPLGRKAIGSKCETFSPVVKPATIRTILSIVVYNGWQLRQVDVNNAFLNGDLTDEVFMQQPPGYVQYGSNGEQLVCRLTKALYRLRQASRAWFEKLKQFLLSTGFLLSKSDASLFVKCKYIRDLLARSSLANAKSVHTPMVSSFSLSKNEGDQLADPTEYRSLAEAEYRSLAAATSDVAWLVSLLTELKLSSADPPAIWCDNSGAVAVAANPVLHSKFKHVELDLFFVREKVVNGSLVVGKVPACDQVTDILTKPLSISNFTWFHCLLRVVPLAEA
ncbi:hypothetical protein CXB51_008701 [Gossypium anomalum]|uniref:Integrase catalytic domain-containing protein n=1 Tax=Gossypium anomalum TaxID=47600 RepID=A0A8J6D3Q7_9ROSI|nr:hypothetical protein CXB51_008701 [Gossypium anomalum]